MMRVPPLLFALCSLALGGAVAAGPETTEPNPKPAGTDIFHPPAASAQEMGSFRSPLNFYDGSPVKTPADWPRRRAEIRARWDSIMGAWPPLLETPKLEVIATEQREDFTQQKVRVQIAADRTADGYLLLPHRPGRRPAVFVPFYEPETSIGLGKPNRDFAYQLTKRGFVTLSIGSPGGDARKPDLGSARCQPLTYLGYIAANCANALAHLPEVDPARLGIVGHSYGGKWAMFGSCLCDRYACAVWSDPGVVFDEGRSMVNYWDPWYLGLQDGLPRPKGLPDAEHPRTGAYAQLIEQKLDLTDLHALMAPRPFLVSGGSEDTATRWPALNHARAVNQFLGYEDRVAMDNRPAHEPTTASNEQIYRFFERVLHPDQ